MTKLTERDVDEIVHLYRKKRIGCVLIGRKYEVGRGTIRARLKQRHVKIRHGKYAKIDCMNGWKEEYENHPGWKGRNTYDLRKNRELKASTFYFAFGRWARKNIAD